MDSFRSLWWGWLPTWSDSPGWVSGPHWMRNCPVTLSYNDHTPIHSFKVLYPSSIVPEEAWLIPRHWLGGCLLSRTVLPLTAPPCTSQSPFSGSVIPNPVLGWTMTDPESDVCCRLSALLCDPETYEEQATTPGHAIMGKIPGWVFCLFVFICCCCFVLFGVVWVFLYVCFICLFVHVSCTAEETEAWRN